MNNKWLIYCCCAEVIKSKAKERELQQPLHVGRVTKAGSLRKRYTKQSPQQKWPGEYQRSRSEVFQKTRDSSVLKQILMRLHTKIRKLGIYTWTAQAGHVGDQHQTMRAHEDGTIPAVRWESYRTNYCIIVRTIVVFLWCAGQKWWCDCGRWDESRGWTPWSSEMGQVAQGRCWTLIPGAFLIGWGTALAEMAAEEFRGGGGLHDPLLPLQWCLICDSADTNKSKYLLV